MRFVAVVSALLLTACPASQNPNGGGNPDGGAGSDAGSNASCPPVPTCTQTITYHGTGTSVSLRGDFADDGWTTGIAMTSSADGFTATIPANNKQVVVYKFVVDGNWVSDPDNTRKSPDGAGGFNSVLRVQCDQCPARAAIDWRDAVMYFAMVDRFADGDVTNDQQVSGVDFPGNYQGGDFKGLQQKIEAGYFDDMGINTLWITSPLDNADGANPGADGHTYSGYHGYWPSKLDQIESHLGSLADLKAMVDAAHAHNIQVLMDYVMNHVHSDSPVYQQHPDWFNPNSNGHGGNCVCGDGCSWDTDRKVCWFDNFLPDFNFNNTDARNYSVANAIAWVKATGVDGFRLDAVKHIEPQWLLDLRARADAEVAWDQPFYMVGETFDGDRDLIKSFVNKSTMLDGQFDFPERGQVLSTLLRRDGQMQDLVGFLDSNDGYYGQNAVMSTFLGNHDVPRSIELALDQPAWGAWDGGKERAWTNQPQTPTTSSPYQRLAVAWTLIMTMPGLPMMYYGDEYGMAGAGDPDNRRFMQWANYTADQLDLKKHLTALIKMRAAHPATRRGTRTTLSVGTDTFVYKMATNGDTVFVALNRGDQDSTANGLPAGTYTDLISGADVTLPATVPARGALVLAQKQ